VKKKALYCSTHKLEGMINVKDKTCIYPNCKTRPIYNIENEKKALYCYTHKLEGMVDIKHKTCIYPNCKIIPIYNIEGQTKALYCYTHKLDGMIDIKHKTCKTYLCYTRISEKYNGYCILLRVRSII